MLRSIHKETAAQRCFETRQTHTARRQNCIIIDNKNTQTAPNGIQSLPPAPACFPCRLKNLKMPAPFNNNVQLQHYARLRLSSLQNPFVG